MLALPFQAAPEMNFCLKLLILNLLAYFYVYVERLLAIDYRRKWGLDNRVSVLAEFMRH